MGDDPSRELAFLSDGAAPGALERGWEEFVDRQTPLLLRAAKAFGGDYDAHMDRYCYILEELQRDQYQRLRAYRPRGSSTFEGWLVVVARRLCLDFDRRRYGRPSRAADPERERAERHDRATRRMLAEPGGAGPDPAELSGSQRQLPDILASEGERRDALEEVLGELEPRERLLLKLRFEDGLSAREIAEVMHFPTVFHVYRRLKNALGEARVRLVSRGYEDSAL